MSSDTANPTPLGQGPTQPPILISVMVQTMDMGLTLGPELTIAAKYLMTLQELAGPPEKNHKMTLKYPDQMQHHHPNLTPITFQLLNVDHSMAPAFARRTKLPSVMVRSPSQPPEPFMQAVDHHKVPPKMTNPTPPCQETGQSPTFPSGMLQTMYMAATISAKAVTEAEHSVSLHEVTISPLKHPKMTLAH